MLGQSLHATSLLATYALRLWSVIDGMACLCHFCGATLHLISAQIMMQFMVSAPNYVTVDVEGSNYQPTQLLSRDFAELSNMLGKKCEH